MKYNNVCKTCNSDNVVYDAWAEWNYDKQEWELHSMYENAYCLMCDGETEIIEIEEDE